MWWTWVWVALGAGDGQESLVCCSPWGCKESDMTEWLNWTVLQHARLPCPSLSPRACSNSWPLSWWCHSTILSSVSPFSSCPQSFPALGFFPMSWLSASGGQSIGASASVLSMNNQGWFPLGLTGLISLLSKGLLKSLLQHQIISRFLKGVALSFTLIPLQMTEP